MARRKRGGADEAFADPAVDSVLDEMVEVAIAAPVSGGVKARRPSVVFQSRSTPLAVSNESGTAIVPAAAPAVPQEPSILKKGLAGLMKDVGADVKGKWNSTEQLLVDGIGLAYKGVKVTLGTAATATATATAVRVAPPAITFVMGLGRTLIDNLPTQSLNDIYETWKEPFIAAGSTAMSAGAFAATPGGALMLGGLLLGAAARGAGKSIPEYLKDIGVGGVEKISSVVTNLKTELDKAAIKNPAAELNAEVKARLREKETKDAVDEYLTMAAERAEREAAEVLMALTNAPSGGRRRKARKTKKRIVKRNVTRRFVY
jgi:hypothetical protein